ncbi:unnamed protein product [Arabis nemorensis]|uniref:Uncharacterized protein n=1 Tax=Arabis nemorensis TaxID=586526 RepID=A0A565B8L4_9BRAS|nr:unnamed protein product [Arabis nemorensis]
MSTRLTIRDKLRLAKKEKADAARRAEEQRTKERCSKDIRTEVQPRSAAGTHIESAIPIADDPVADQTAHSPSLVRAALTRYESARAPRPTVSSLVHHEEISHRDESRKRGTDSRRESHSEERVFKEPRRYFSDRGAATSELDQTAPNVLSRITLSGTRFPPPATWRAMGTTPRLLFIAHLNKMVLDYEAQSRAGKRHLESVQRDVEKYKYEESTAKKRFADSESEVKRLRDQLGKVQKKNEDLTASNVRRFQRLQDCYTKLSLHEKREESVQQAVHGARVEMAIKFRETLTRIQRQLDVVEEARGESFDLAQAESNLQLAELAAVVAGSARAHKRLTDEVENLRKILRAPSVELDNSEYVEVTAASLGVRNFSGTNGGTSGLHDLRVMKAAPVLIATEPSPPAPEALATVAADPTVVSLEQATEVVVPLSGGGVLEDGEPARVDGETVEKVPEEATERVSEGEVDVPEQVAMGSATDEAAEHDGDGGR